MAKHDLKVQREKKKSSDFFAIPASHTGTACPAGHFLFLSRDWWAQNRSFTDWNQISVMGPAAVNGCHVCGCQRRVCLSPPRVISAWWSRPRRQSVADVIYSYSVLTCGNGNQCQCWEKKRPSDLVSAYIYLPDTLNCEGPAESSSICRQNPITGKSFGRRSTVNSWGERALG